MWLNKQLVTDVHERVRVFYVSWAAACHWNERRDKDEPRIFGGWYWAHGRTENGPFRSMSACYRDAWYKVVARTEAPRLYRRELEDEKPTAMKRREEAKRMARRARPKAANGAAATARA
jgi:hypothetical protein